VIKLLKFKKMENFNEKGYLDVNPDVRIAVESGVFSSGEEHYKLFGKAEGRSFSNRYLKILEYINKNKNGLEIGPSFRPVAPKKSGYNVKIIDHLDQNGLRQKYQDHNHKLDLDAIEEVDYIWSGEPLSEIIKETFDWIIASHVIEHTPDLIGFLNQCELLLDQGGILSLAVPDKRYCFDYNRELTSISKIIDSRGNKVHSPGTVAEYFLKVVSKDGQIAWDNDSKGNFQNVHSVQDAIKEMQQAQSGIYVDVHAWVFTPDSLQIILHDLYSLGLINMKIKKIWDTVGHEFFMTLEKDS
jgi:hypothetical protein